MQRYLEPTAMLDFGRAEIEALIRGRGWRSLAVFERIGAAYAFVQNEIRFGYNKKDTLTASQVLKDGLGQCNTKATLLMALLRAVDIPCRLHGAMVSKEFQRGAATGLIARAAPSRIVHTWAEVYYAGDWLALEGVITDLAYIAGLKSMFPGATGRFFRYAVAVEDFSSLALDWAGKSTWVQSLAVVEDLGIYDSPDAFFGEHRQTIRGLKNFLYQTYARKVMTRNVAKVRKKALP